MGIPGTTLLEASKPFAQLHRPRVHTQRRTLAELEAAQTQTAQRVAQITQPEFSDEQWGRAIAKPIYKMISKLPKTQLAFLEYMEATDKREYLANLPEGTIQDNMVVLFDKIETISLRNDFEDFAEVQRQLYALIKPKLIQRAEESQQEKEQERMRQVEQKKQAAQMNAQYIVEELKRPVSKLGLDTVHYILKRPKLRTGVLGLNNYLEFVDASIRRPDAREAAQSAFTEAFTVSQAENLPVGMILEEIFSQLEARKEKLEKIRQKRLMNNITLDKGLHRKILGLLEVNPTEDDLKQYHWKVRDTWNEIKDDEDMKANLLRLEEMRQEKELEKKAQEKPSMWKRVKGWFGR